MQFYRWKVILISEGAAVFKRKSSATRRERVEALERSAVLEEKLQWKDGVMVELPEEHGY